MSSRLLLILYGLSGLIWSLILIYYLNNSIMSNRKPTWYRSIKSVPESTLVILYGSVLLSPAFVFFSIILLAKKLLWDEEKKNKKKTNKVI